MMDIKAVVLSSVAILGSGGLLWTGYSSASNDNQGKEYSEQEEARNLQQRGDILSLEQILQNARQHHEGRILEAELERERGVYVYEVELLDEQGQVWEMKLDAISGELIKEEQED